MAQCLAYFDITTGDSQSCTTGQALQYISRGSLEYLHCPDCGAICDAPEFLQTADALFYSNQEGVPFVWSATAWTRIATIPENAVRGASGLADDFPPVPPQIAVARE